MTRQTYTWTKSYGSWCGRTFVKTDSDYKPKFGDTITIVRRDGTSSEKRVIRLDSKNQHDDGIEYIVNVGSDEQYEERRLVKEKVRQRIQRRKNGESMLKIRLTS